MPCSILQNVLFPLYFEVLKIFAVFEPVLWNERSKEPIRWTESNCPSLFPFSRPCSVAQWPVEMENRETRLWIETCLGMQLQFGNTRVFRSLDCQIWNPGVTVMISFRLTFTERIFICLCALPPAGENLNHRTEFGLVTKLQGILVLNEW